MANNKYLQNLMEPSGPTLEIPLDLVFDWGKHIYESRHTAAIGPTPAFEYLTAEMQEVFTKQVLDDVGLLVGAGCTFRKSFDIRTEKLKQGLEEYRAYIFAIERKKTEIYLSLLDFFNVENPRPNLFSKLEAYDRARYGHEIHELRTQHCTLAKVIVEDAFNSIEKLGYAILVA